ncbi:hypothetical protein [Nonomuraea sp. 10N515B]|uniref:hypothetical protein n=1 Tax=Nonomuraea sp. 10N515B TaxID=3457422 RepID=UPI003FCDDC1D
MDSRRIDALMAAGVLVAIMAGTYGNLSWTGPYERPLDGVGITLIVVASVSMAWRRAAPLAAGLFAVAAAIVYQNVGQCSGVYAGGEGPRGSAR